MNISYMFYAIVLTLVLIFIEEIELWQFQIQNFLVISSMMF